MLKYKPQCIRMTSDECRPLHKAEAKRDKALTACEAELHRLIVPKVHDYSLNDARAQALMDILLANDGETAIAAATSYLEGCGFTVTNESADNG